MTQALYERAKALIPGGTQLLSKRPELFLPEQWPAYYRRARGVEIEDLEGRTYVDVSIAAVGSCPLGYADPDVDEAVVAAVRSGSISTLNCPEEVELAELLCALHPWADMVRYTRAGGEAMAVAARIARAATGRDRIAVSGYHGWHDWYLAANLGSPAALDGHLLPDVPTLGLPRALEGSVLAFGFADEAALEAIVDAHGPDLAAIVLEPARYTLPPAGFLERVRAIADRIGAVLVFDEITTGFRLAVGGAHLELGVAPDVAVFAKAMSNGYAMGAVVGRREVMQVADQTFISSTYWTERIGPTAACATIRKLREHNVPSHLARMGERMRSGWAELAAKHGLEVETRGVAALPAFSFLDPRAGLMASLYTQSMLDAGFLASGAFYPTWAHTPRIVDAALEAADRAFADIGQAARNDSLAQALRGPPAQQGLRKAPARAASVGSVGSRATRTDEDANG